MSISPEHSINATSGNDPGALVSIRTDLRPEDIGFIVYVHGMLYAREYGFDPTFEAYVAGPLAEFALATSAGERLLTRLLRSREARDTTLSGERVGGGGASLSIGWVRQGRGSLQVSLGNRRRRGKYELRFS